MRYIFLLLVAFGFFQLSAQTGNYFLTHHSPPEYQGNFMCFDIAQDHEGLFYYATRKGILTFDGKNWELLSGKGAVYSLSFKDGEKPTMYWAGDAGYGKVERAATGKYQITTLSGKDTVDVFESLLLNNQLYLLSSQTLVVEGVKTIRADQSTGLFTGMIELFGQVYVVTENQGPLQLSNQNQLQSPSFTLPESGEVLFATKQGDEYLIGFSSNKVYRINSTLKLSELKLEDQKYIDASVIVGGTWVNKDLFVLGTLRGGLIFIHAATGKTQEIINYNTGLPDNEIFVLVSGKNQSIWAAHEYGFTRVASHLPFRSFSHYPGLSGNLLCAKTFQDQVYVGTSLGLFYLERQEQYEEITYYVTERVPDKKNATTTVVAEEQKPESRKKGFLRFRKKDRDEEKQKPNTVEPSQPVYRQVKKTDRILRSAQFVYKKVEGIDSKVTHLIQLQDKLIAGGLSGLFQVNANKAVTFENEPIRDVYASENLNAIVASTYSDEIKTYMAENGSWLKQTPLPNFRDEITSIVDGNRDELWLLGQDQAYQLKIDKRVINGINTVPVNNPKLDENLGVVINNQFVVVNNSGFFSYNSAKNVFAAIDTLPPPTHYVVHNNHLLFHDTHNWRQLGGNVIQNIHLINLLPDIRFMAKDDNKNALWLVKGNTLFRFLSDEFNATELASPVVCKNIFQGEEHIPFDDVVVQENNALSFEFTQADFFAADAIEFRYKLIGLDKTWSAWSRDNRQIDFPYLPSGDYTLEVESRNVFGVQSAAEPIRFEVLPPYWQRPWFYALEFIVFAVLVVLSYRLSERYLIISRVLSLLTIIMLIQFIQTVVSEVFETRASPVMDFFMQVMVAFLILPVEGYLRRRMIRSSSEEAKEKLAQFIQRKGKPTTEKDE